MLLLAEVFHQIKTGFKTTRLLPSSWFIFHWDKTVGQSRRFRRILHSGDFENSTKQCVRKEVVQSLVSLTVMPSNNNWWRSLYAENNNVIEAINNGLNVLLWVMAVAVIDRRDTQRTFLPLLTNMTTFQLEFMANYISIKEARAKLPREPSVCVTPGRRPCGGQMGNSLSDGGRATEFKGDAAWRMNLLQRVNRKLTHSVPSIWTEDAISHLKVSY